MIDIKAKRHLANSSGFEHWAKIQNLKEMLAENKKRCLELKQVRAKMIELMTAKNNNDRFLGLPSVQEKRPSRQREDGNKFRCPTGRKQTPKAA